MKVRHTTIQKNESLNENKQRGIKEQEQNEEEIKKKELRKQNNAYHNQFRKQNSKLQNDRRKDYAHRYIQPIVKDLKEESLKIEQIKGKTQRTYSNENFKKELMILKLIVLASGFFPK
jgi:hypothetical protein